MHVLGIYSRLDQVFDAPDVVKEALTSQFGLENSVCFLSFLSIYLVPLNIVGLSSVKIQPLAADLTFLIHGLPSVYWNKGN